MRQVVFLLSFIFCVFAASPLAKAQEESSKKLKVALILPFQTGYTSSKIGTYLSTNDIVSANKIRLPEDSQNSLNFYQGLLLVLQEANNENVKLFVYDNQNSDSITNVLLNKPELKGMNAIIGPMTISSARVVAEYCKTNKILNLQPFSPSKTLSENNPFLIQLAPTIEVHTEQLFKAMVDSFQGGNIIIYSPPSERSLSIARYMDTLIKNYNKSAEKKFTSVFLNTKDMMVDGKKTTAGEQLKTNKKNVWFIPSFDEAFLNGNFRILHSQLNAKNITVFGMPTWLNGDILRLDYVNDFQTHISDPFYIDSASSAANDFLRNFITTYHHTADRYAALGYDVFHFLDKNWKEYEADLANASESVTYHGVGYNFNLTKKMIGDNINYFGNNQAFVFKVMDYRLTKVR